MRASLHTLPHFRRWLWRIIGAWRHYSGTTAFPNINVKLNIVRIYDVLSVSYRDNREENVFRLSVLVIIISRINEEKQVVRSVCRTHN